MVAQLAAGFREVGAATAYYHATIEISKGATDADAQAEKGQAKERAWELFTG